MPPLPSLSSSIDLLKNPSDRAVRLPHEPRSRDIPGFLLPLGPWWTSCRNMIALFTDFGLQGPYLGQVKGVLCREAPGICVIDLFCDAPVYDPRAGAYLLAAYAEALPVDAVLLCVVDPGVGSERKALALRAGGCWFVGPDNGLLAIAARRARAPQWWEIRWESSQASSTFHGRDVFAPAAAAIARGLTVPGRVLVRFEPRGNDWPDDLAEVVYVDRFGNGITGLRANRVGRECSIGVNGISLRFARTYSEVQTGAAFWYENANGLVEIAVNCGRADERFGLRTGVPVAIGH